MTPGCLKIGPDIADLPIVRELLSSPIPAVVYKVRVDALGEPSDSPQIRALQEQVRSSNLARRLLHHRQPDGTIPTHPYAKWQGPHWTLACLAEIGYPPGDESLIPLRDQFYGWLFAKEHLKMPRTLLIPGQEDRVRRCASQEANAVWYSLALGIADERTEMLVERLKAWQWPDGGWNCDKRPEARKSSFVESIIPLRALALYGRLRGDAESLGTARRAAGVFLSRNLYRRIHDGAIAIPDSTLIQYPYYVIYSTLFALRVMAEAGFIQDECCREALDLLEAKRLPDGGFPNEKRNYTAADEITTRGSFVDWGPTGKRTRNDFVTADALYVLKKAGRL